MQREGDNQLLRFGEINKGVRGDFPHCGVLPAHKNFHAAGFKRPGINNRLVDHVKLFAADGGENFFAGV